MNIKKDTFTISELAAELELSPSAIRYYEDRGLISPQRTPGNQRIYTKKNRARLKLIMRGKRFGATLDEIAEMIGSANADLNEKSQIMTSLKHIEKKHAEIKKHEAELKIFEQDLTELRMKLQSRLNELE